MLFIIGMTLGHMLSSDLEIALLGGTVGLLAEFGFRYRIQQQRLNLRIPQEITSDDT